jgi:hypothetical protein
MLREDLETTRKRIGKQTVIRGGIFHANRRRAAKQKCRDPGDGGMGILIVFNS